ncbi:hypothetical protein V495_02538 [Pseudogymnoascus sp. VKM F-4514 (FW-929)]|nr:hypothetical protein V495_02538 [Pseudogymnoascus sp. VKM F-4514 (FW-929)]
MGGLVPPRDRQDRCHGIELGGLLEEVREVVGLPAHGWGDHLVDFLVREVVLFGDAEPRVHGEAIGEHPAFDDEGRDHLVNFFVREVVLFGDAKPRVHGEAVGEHPAFDDEGPGV